MDDKMIEKDSTTLKSFLEEWNDKNLYIKVFTSGSTGNPKPIFVEKKRMEASARTTCSFLSLDSSDTALLCLPLDYIAGKMVVVRSLVCGMRLISVKPSSNPLRQLAEVPSFAAMVSMQVYGSMQTDEEFRMLRQIKNLIIGGGAIDADMTRKLRDFPNAVWSTYGMTETLSHIALRRLSGSDASDYYTPFDGLSLSVDKENCLVIDAPKVCTKRLYTNDIVEFHPDGKRFRVIGRRDNVIDSGGVKIHAELVEDKLRGKLNFDFAVTKRSHPKYGEIVVLLVAVPYTDDNSSLMQKIRNVCNDYLPKYWQPKEICLTETIPHTETGKIARKRVLQLVENK